MLSVFLVGIFFSTLPKSHYFQESSSKSRRNIENREVEIELQLSSYEHFVLSHLVQLSRRSDNIWSKPTHSHNSSPNNEDLSNFLSNDNF